LGALSNADISDKIDVSIALFIFLNFFSDVSFSFSTRSISLLIVLAKVFHLF